MVAPIDRAELLRLIEEEEAQLVDVLPEREYAEAHLPGAISLYLRRMTPETVTRLRRDKPVVVYCHDAL
jgi:rhodanese-related sulfurtransferase